jgi:K+-sensing histidine kinase KdpD
LKRYSVSVLSVLTASILTNAIEPFFGGKAPLFFFTVAVILSAAYGSIGPGLLATALSIGILLSLFPHEIFVLALAHSSLTVSLMLFAVIGVAVSIVTGKLHWFGQSINLK